MIATIAPAAAALRIVVLCAGFSTRLGRPKALSRVHGVTLLQRTVRTVGGLTAGKIIVVLPPSATRARAELRGERVEIAESRHRARGLSASIRCGLRRSRYDAAALLLPVDLAYLKRRDIERLIARWRSSRRCIAARRLGDRAVSPLVLPRRLYPEAMRIVGDRGLRDWLSGSRLQPRLVDLPSAALDVDTPADLNQARKRLRF